MMKLLFAFFASSCFILLSVANNIDVKNTQIWGPALRSEARLPVRYFYVQAYDKKNKIIKNDLGDDAFKFTLGSPSGARVRAWVTLLNRHNGSYIGRFRMYDYSGDITISVTHKGNHVAQSPYTIKDVYGDECDCPLNNRKQWMKALECPSSYKQIEEDFKNRETIDLTTLKEKVLARYGKHHSLCHYVVKDNEVYRECHGSITDFKMFMDTPMLNLARKVKLPDVEFFINLGDWPLVKSPDDPLPIVSWCGSDNTYDIILPTYDITNSVLEMLGRVSLDIFSVQSNTGPKWKNKIEKGFFRGRDSRRERLNLAGMSQENPELLDAKITNYFFFRKEEEKYGKVKSISFFDFFQYKYQINVDGTVAAYRFPYLMAGDALVMKQDSEYYEHFYREMKPDVHYIPLKRDLSDVTEKIKWAKKNDQKAQEIQRAGTDLARRILTPAQILCYHVAFFEQYSRRQNQPVTVLSSMEKLDQPNKNCNCRKKKRKSNKTKDEL
ncbi:unnamed protein product [Clavelina lepadiformis]|uniref:Glycosyl transferase CAP10 domain-containing protein n=1 Tax=Clavelina lepadiformis TaxID=159417 RepID=A0ABP0EZQ9_CLALP